MYKRTFNNRAPRFGAIVQEVRMAQFNTAPRAYFEAIRNAMAAKGYKLLAWITTNSKLFRYHLDCFEYSQHSRMFFSIPDKTCIVMLELVEQFRADGTHQCYWRGRVIVAWSHKREVRDLTQGTDDPDIFPTDIGHFFDGSPFKAISTKRSYNDVELQFEQLVTNKKDYLDPLELTAPLKKLIHTLYPYMFRQFLYLDIESFAPSEYFDGCRRKFWQQFPVARVELKVSGELTGVNSYA